MKKTLLVFGLLFSVTFYVIGCGMLNRNTPEANEFKVQIVGDSVFDREPYVHKYLKILSGKAYKDNASSGDAIKYITNQYRKAIASNPDIRTIIMDGGANDIITSLNWNLVCRTSENTLPKECQSFLNGIGDEIDSLWDEMDTDGIDDIVHMGYYHLKTGYLIGQGKNLSAAVDYANSILQTGCYTSAADCHFVDTKESFKGNEASYITSDGIHPTEAGGKVIAGLIWKQMVSANVYR